MIRWTMQRYCLFIQLIKGIKGVLSERFYWENMRLLNQTVSLFHDLLKREQWNWMSTLPLNWLWKLIINTLLKILKCQWIIPAKNWYLGHEGTLKEYHFCLGGFCKMAKFKIGFHEMYKTKVIPHSNLKKIVKW